MEIVSKFVSGLLLVAFAIIAACTIGALTGAFSGWILSIFMPVWLPLGFSKFGINIMAKDLIAIGATLGFIGGFFRASGAKEK